MTQRFTPPARPSAYDSTPRSTVGTSFRWLVASIALGAVFSACVTGPPPAESAIVRNTGDTEVAKLRQLAEVNIAARFDRASAAAWQAWREAVDAAKALDKTGAGMVPAEFMEKATDLRDDKLARIATAKARALGQAADLHGNYVTSSGAIWDAWAAQGKVTGETVNALREAATQGVQMYGEYRQQRSLAREAKRAAEAAKAEAAEGE